MKPYSIFAFVVANKHNVQDSFQVQNDAGGRVQGTYKEQIPDFILTLTVQ